MLSVPVVLLAMIAPLQFDNWQWLSLTLAAPVVVWAALPFHRAAWVNARHAAATMDTLISVGVLAAFGWSLFALFLGHAGETGMRMTFRLLPEPGSGAHEIYLEVAAAVTVFILAGRYFEAGQRSAPAPRCMRCWRWARRTLRCAGTAARCASWSTSSRSARSLSFAPGRRSPPTASW